MLEWASAPRRTVAAWALYDWAAQPFFTVVLTFVFGPYFQSYVASTPAQGQVWWGYGAAAAGASVALTAPFFGAWVDASGKRLRWLVFSMLLMSIGLSVTWFALPGADGRVILILGGIVLATLGAEYGILITNAMMPDLAAPEHIGKLSGFGWAVGYLGGLVLLCFVLFALVLPEQPLFGLDRATHAPDRSVGPLAIVWLWVFALPLLFLAPKPSGSASPPLAVGAFSALFDVLRAWRSHKNVLLYLLSRMLYYDGVTAVYLFGGLYAAGTLGWETAQLGVFGIILIIAGAIGTFVGGKLDDALGSKATVSLSLAGIMVAVVGILSIEVDRVFFAFPAQPHVPGAGFSSLPAQVMLACGVGVGLFLGPVQSASRTLMVRISRPDELNTFFGLYALTGRATAFVAPLVVAALTDFSGSRRIGIAAILVLLALGFVLLMRVREEGPAAP